LAPISTSYRRHGDLAGVRGLRLDPAQGQDHRRDASHEGDDQHGQSAGAFHEVPSIVAVVPPCTREAK
jgi:hypothetical protein